AADRAARVLVEDEALEGDPVDLTVPRLDRPAGAEERQCATREDAGIGGDRAAWREGHAEAADPRALAHAEEHVGLVVREDARALGRPSGEPLPERPHRQGLGLEMPLVDQQLPDAPVRAPVRRDRAHAKLAASGKAERAAALDLEEEHVHGVAGPGERTGELAEPPLLDLRATPVGAAPPRVEIAGDAEDRDPK